MLQRTENGLSQADRENPAGVEIYPPTPLMANGLQNPQPHGLAQQAEAKGNLLQLLFGQQIIGLSDCHILLSLYIDTTFMNTLQVKTSIQPLELQRLLAVGAPAQLLDVRTPGEFAAAHVPGANLIPLDDLNPGAFQRQRGSEEIPVYVLCQSGGRARKAVEKLEQGGVQGCLLVEGGTQAWIDAGLPTEWAPSTVLPLMRQCRSQGRMPGFRWGGSTRLKIEGRHSRHWLCWRNDPKSHR